MRTSASPPTSLAAAITRTARVFRIKGEVAYRLIVVDRIDLPLGAPVEQHVLSESLPGELVGRQQQALEHRLERVELLGAAPHAFFDFLRRHVLGYEHAAEVVGVEIGVWNYHAAFVLELRAHRRADARRHRIEERLG